MSGRWRWPVLLAGLALLRSLALGVSTPPYQASDEPWHLDYARAISQLHWPVLGRTPMDPAIVEHDRVVSAAEERPLHGIDDPPMSREAYQPPLAYVVPAIGYAMAGGPDGGLTWFRSVNAVVGAAIAVAAYGMGRRAFPSSPWAGPFAGVVTVGLPSMATVTSWANNDALVILFGVLAMKQAADCVRTGASVARFAGLGALVGLSGWAKAGGLLLVVPALMSALLAPSADARLRWRRIAVVAATAAVVIAPWIGRNLSVYGDPFGTSAFADVTTPHPGRDLGGLDLLLFGTPTHPDAERFWPELARSSIGTLGWSDVPLPPWAYLLAGLGATAAIVAAIRWLRRADPVDRRVALMLLSPMPAFIAAVAWLSMTVDYQPQGRYLLPALAAAAAVVGASLSRAGFAGGAVMLGVLFAAAVGTTIEAYGWP